MSLLGKILAFLNLLGAAGLLAIASMDYGRHLTWQEAVFRHDVRLNGLPLSEQDADKQGRPLVDSLSKSVLSEAFDKAGTPVKTQIEEVKRVKEVLDPKIAAAGDQQKQLVAYAGILLPFATSNLQRENLLAIHTRLADAKAYEGLKQQLTDAVAAARAAMMQDNRLKFPEALAAAMKSLGGEPARPFEQGVASQLAADGTKTVDQALKMVIDTQHAALKGQYDGMFADALDWKKPLPEGNKQERPDDEHRQAVAHLLFNLLESLPATDAAAQAVGASPVNWDNENYRRFFAVVGLQSALREINAAALVLALIRDELAKELGRDRGTFALSHNQLVYQVQEIAERLDKVRADLSRIQKQSADQKQLVVKRQKDVDEAEAELAASRQVTTERLRELDAMRQALRNIRIEVRDATVENQNRARKIAELEDKAAK